MGSGPERKARRARGFGVEMNLYRTTDTSASIHKAHAQFTHVMLNRAYALHSPALFDSRKILDLPLYETASWLPETGQLTGWRENGGVLVVRDANVFFPCDAALLVECPIKPPAIEEAIGELVIPDPGSWVTHDDYIDLRFPVPDVLRALWTVCAGKEMTTKELAEAVDMPVTQVTKLKSRLEPDELWYIHKRLAPEREEMIPAWDWLQGGAVRRAEITKAGFRPMVEEMARFGYVGVKKIYRYAQREPNWRTFRKEREAALKNLAAVRLLVESLPDYLET